MNMLTPLTIVLLSLFTSCAPGDTSHSRVNGGDTNKIKTTTMNKPEIVKTDEEWKKTLTPEQYNILREKGTERAFTGAYWDNHASGIYKCAACGTVLFSSSEKFDSGCGWPSFSMPFDSTTCAYHDDSSFGMKRTEVTCRKCGGHLGHVFDDGPPPTGMRYCINSGALIFEQKDK